MANVKRGTSTSSGFTGRIYWSSDENGFIRPELGDAQKFNVAYDLLFNEATSAMPGTVRGVESIDGVETTIVRVTSDYSDAIDLYIDPQTGAYKRAVIDPNGTYETVLDIDAYADALTGKKIISKWHGESGRFHEWTHIAANALVTDSDLHPPKQTATWTFAAPHPIPIKLTQSRIYIDAKVNGVPGRFILDTGASGIFLKQSFADRAHVKPFDVAKAGGVGGAIATSVVRVDSIEIGGNKLSNVIADAQSLARFDADGLMGFDLLAATIANLDLSNQQLTLYDPSSMSVDTNSGIVATVDLSTGQPRLPMKLNGRIDVNALMDTGDPYYVLYGHDLIYKYGLTTLRAEALMAGVGGYELVNCGVIDQLSVGPVVYQMPSACESSSFTGRNILVGLDFLKNFDFVFDYSHAHIVMIPRKTQ
jgi:predicted aspartyl protease